MGRNQQVAVLPVERCSGGFVVVGVAAALAAAAATCTGASLKARLEKRAALTRRPLNARTLTLRWPTLERRLAAARLRMF